ncbi:glutamate receptor ionotropic, delta-2-like [Centruroides sculpturatus]|uniref:glutamate receptor ionotropic, delta-2-like n=1 Tax=Centruroides sculpturatus TaxID=218467 RepID=UPI000C6D3989|nr:glutamate receptor ionotropic, delta-2-like [Centruroides sculpturatus]
MEQKQEADIGFPTGITYDRLEAVDYTDIYHVLRVNFYTKKPDELSKMLAVIYPFDISVWIATVIFFVISSLSFYFIINHSRKLHEKREIKLYDIIWALFGSLTDQGNDIFEMDKSNRIMIFAWLISSFILVSSYSGAIMSFIIHAGHEEVPRTFQELIAAIKENTYRAGALFHTGVGKNVDDATETSPLLFGIKKLHEQGKVINIGPNDDVYELLLMKKFALIHYDIDGKAYTSALGINNYIYSKESLYSQYEILAIRKEFPYKQLFNKCIRRIIESGLFCYTVNYQVNKLRHTKVIPEKDTDPKPLTVEDLIGAFCVLIIGYVLSISVFILELLTNVSKFSKLLKSKKSTSVFLSE